MLVGIAGSFVGGTVAELLQIPVFGFWRTLIAAIIGAVVILFIWRSFRDRAASSRSGIELVGRHGRHCIPARLLDVAPE